MGRAPLKKHIENLSERVVGEPLFRRHRYEPTVLLKRLVLVEPMVEPLAVDGHALDATSGPVPRLGILGRLCVI